MCFSDMNKEPNRGHLRRLPRIWRNSPLFFVTSCTFDRKPILANQICFQIVSESLKKSEELFGWKVGCYVLMPNHLHFFCGPCHAAMPLSVFMGSWKRFTSNQISERLGIDAPIWQKEFFDHLLRSEESTAQKWDYVRMNPVRAGLTDKWEDWPYRGEINSL